MSERCSCGTTLVEGALFCHRCGRPLREDLVEATPVAAPAPTVTPAVDPGIVAEISHRRALRASLIASLAAFLMMTLLGQILGAAAIIVTVLLAGFFSPYLYYSGSVPVTPLTRRASAGVGWTTGVFTFLMYLIQLTISVVLSGNSLRETLLKQVQQQAAGNPSFKDAAEVIATNSGLAIFLATTMVLLFVVCTLLSTLGALLGAQFGAAAKRQRHS